MSDTKDTGGNTGGRKPLTVSRKTSGTVKQSFSHGRSKTVVVETEGEYYDKGTTVTVLQVDGMRIVVAAKEKA